MLIRSQDNPKESQEYVENRLIDYIELYDKKQKSNKDKLMENYFHPNINNLSKSSAFAETGSKFKDFKVYPDGKVPDTRPERWVVRKKKRIRAQIKKNKPERSLNPINISDLKKQVQDQKNAIGNDILGMLKSEIKKDSEDIEGDSESKETVGLEGDKSDGKDLSLSTKKSSNSTAKVVLMRNRRMGGWGLIRRSR